MHPTLDAPALGVFTGSLPPSLYYISVTSDKLHKTLELGRKH
jgi:hypothetical protein